MEKSHKSFCLFRDLWLQNNLVVTGKAVAFLQKRLESNLDPSLLFKTETLVIKSVFRACRSNLFKIDFQ